MTENLISRRTWTLVKRRLESTAFAPIKWPNLKAQAKLDAEVSIDFRNWQEAVGGV